MHGCTSVIDVTAICWHQAIKSPLHADRRGGCSDIGLYRCGIQEVVAVLANAGFRGIG